MFKSQLQEYAQKAGLPPPVYESVKEGPSHEPRFRANVTFQGVTYESLSFFPSLKQAEHAAANAALQAIGTNSNGNGIATGTMHESGLCKSLLQEYAQKCNLRLPVYHSERSGETHMPTFTSTVEIGGAIYRGGAAKNKKEAEIKAAKAALLAIHSQTRVVGSQAALDSFGGRKRGRNAESVSKGPLVTKQKVEQFAKVNQSTAVDGLATAPSVVEARGSVMGCGSIQQQQPLQESEGQVVEDQLQVFSAQDPTFVGISVGSA